MIVFFYAALKPSTVFVPYLDTVQSNSMSPGSLGEYVVTSETSDKGRAVPTMFCKPDLYVNKNIFLEFLHLVFMTTCLK